MLWLRVIVASLALLLFITGAPATGADENEGHYQGFGDPGGFLNILPPGQDGSLNGIEAIVAQTGQTPPHFQDQLAMYGDLVYNTPGLSEDRLEEFFKDASFGVKPEDVDRTYSPTEGVTVIRDNSFGVPHIFGETRYATMFAQGYTAAEDRLFLMDALRHVGRARLSEFLGASPSNLALDRDQLAIAPYKEEDLTAQLEAAIAAAGPEGEALHADLLAYVDGVNQYINEAITDPQKLPAEYPALQQAPLPWQPEDTVAIASLVGGIFGKGGGGELRNFCGLQELTANLGDAAAARSVFDDLHFANDTEAPTTTDNTFPYLTDLGPVNPAAHPDIDCGSLQPVDDGATSVDDVLAAISDGLGVKTVDAPWGSFDLNFTDAISNAVLIGGERTQSGHPLAVFGPQTSYYVPQLLVEKDVHGPGIDARGASFAGTDLYVQLGRGVNYAWSATSAGADNIDQFVLRLCEPGGGPATTESMGYLRNGVCEPIETYQHTQVAKPSAGGIPEGPDIVLSWRVERTEHYGPVAARGTLADGTPIAIGSLRTTYFNELGSARGFSRVNNPDFMTGGFDSFREAMGRGVDYTFNWFYIDTEDIGYQHSCRCPQRAQGLDPYLPAWGTGEYDWTGFIAFEAQPHDLNPDKGYITSWNNRQAPGWKANDRNFSYGPVYRDQMLNLRVERAFAEGLLNRADVVDVMEDAGTVDLRGQEVLPFLLQALGDAPAGVDPRTVEMRDRLAAWAAADAHRRDHDADGEYDDAVSPAIMDAWWPFVSHGVFDGAGQPLDALGISLDDSNRVNHIGSAFQDGTHGHVQKALRQLLGLPVAGAFANAYCGGSQADCRDIFWQSLALAADALEAEFESPDVADWQRAVADEDVRHSEVGVVGVPAIHWINRPTFQQVVQINGPEPAGKAFGSGSLEGPGGKKIGFTMQVEAFSNGTGQGRFQLHDHGSKEKIDLGEIDSMQAPAGSGCGQVPAGGAGTFEFTGSGAYEGAAGHTVRVCVQDNGDPGKNNDRIHAQCLTCPYDTTPPYTSEVISAGNIRVIGMPGAAPDEPAPDEPSVVILDPALGGGLLLTATVLDASGDPLSGVPVTLQGASLLPLTAVTDLLGQAVFIAPRLGTAQASAGGIGSNPVLLLQ